MDIIEYEQLPDGLDKPRMKFVYESLLKELKSDSLDDALAKLDIVCDKQWHTYELPDAEVQESISEWLISNWKHSDEYLELVLSVCYCFGLSKRLFILALDEYKGDARDEFEGHLKMSLSDHIDPYWSLR